MRCGVIPRTELFAVPRAGAALSTILVPLDLDPLTVADDPDFLARIAAQPNLPDAIRNGLAARY